jgi:hypothetical protein
MIAMDELFNMDYGHGWKEYAVMPERLDMTVAISSYHWSQKERSKRQRLLDRDSNVRRAKRR